MKEMDDIFYDIEDVLKVGWWWDNLNWLCDGAWFVGCNTTLCGVHVMVIGRAQVLGVLDIICTIAWVDTSLGSGGSYDDCWFFMVVPRALHGRSDYFILRLKNRACLSLWQCKSCM